MATISLRKQQIESLTQELLKLRDDQLLYCWRNVPINIDPKTTYQGRKGVTYAMYYDALLEALNCRGIKV